MATEQRRALADTIPTTEVIKDAVTFPRDRLGEPLDISPERFEAWLARVRRDAARGALDGLAREVRRLIPEADPAQQDRMKYAVGLLAAEAGNYSKETP